MTRYVHDFADGDMTQRDRLGGKGANLAEMTKLGLPVPPGFTITTDACVAYLDRGHEPDGLAEEVGDHLSSLEVAMGRRLGDPRDPLLVSVRSGASQSMPGMMETVLNVGLNDRSVAGLARASGDERFAADSYRRLLHMFGTTVLGLVDSAFVEALDGLKHERGVTEDIQLDAADLRQLIDAYQRIISAKSGRNFPQDPREQLALSLRAVFDSWNTERAILYRRQEGIPDDIGTAVTVQAMVFGNRGPSSGSGVAFTRDPATGRRGAYGDYLQNAQGEDVVAGIRNTVSLADLAHIDPASHDELMGIMERLEKHYRDLCDIEFTIDDGKLWMLQTRVGKRTAEAAFRIADQMVDEGVIDLDEALRRVTGSQLAQLMFPQFDTSSPRQRIARGVGASPGAASGEVVFDSATATKLAAEGRAVILVRRETTPDDLPGMSVARGVLTSRGGKTSHAAVVARGMGRVCVCGADELDIDITGRRMTLPDGTIVREHEPLSIDGTTGEVFSGHVPVTDSVVMRALGGGRDESGDELVGAVRRLTAHADAVRRLSVRANADTAEDATNARRLGAEGIGLCRTEHMFLGPRRRLIEDLIVAEDADGQRAALDALLSLQREDFTAILAAMDGLPVTIRLIDPPLHEFLPEADDLAEEPDPRRKQRLSAALDRLREQNPMLGLRGVRLGFTIPGLVRMQARAVFEAGAERLRAGGDPRPEIMVPLVSTAAELRVIREEIETVAEDVASEHGIAVGYRIGTMIEVPRAALTAEDIARFADFFSFGTNDLTQLTWGFSRDDVEASFLPTYLDRGILPISPFETIDVDGVGALVRAGLERGRSANAALHLGVCGEHGGDPASVRFFDEIRLDYVSCSPYRIPVARLEAARAVLMDP